MLFLQIIGLNKWFWEDPLPKYSKGFLLWLGSKSELLHILLYLFPKRLKNNNAQLHIVSPRLLWYICIH